MNEAAIDTLQNNIERDEKKFISIRAASKREQRSVPLRNV